ncbi:phospholemman [Gambusia affinis]|uniref:phospholemman n=1 Tax=Gambusia affinis TaxID=33528 RepID=UPI000F3A6885|nr:phospholemman [Gambusia affinis]
MSKIPTLVFVTFLSLVSVNAEATNDNGEEAFTFDYHRLRVGGLILAAVLCLIGITILFSGHCRCKFNQNKRRRTGSNAQQMLNDQGRACDC